ncbi:PREDICTED: UDP-N-acetylglucosamine transferase subunit ALG14 homolog isoform X1 [Fragaria vesca subsp. vesca]|uniref:UDP-N-acetylglucosamine transferase subunit ALG14 homolog isoform X1 n=1 Tax=Fragaria vesca subsp. vesca TaxID=101020 RepID=UPI0002C30A6F|nr:PREDICTED: UDP-N-acetylglucosamine transferase subunit ALG14 homolog isoform X1 [Fragaria vesca subsp. vesca]
MLLCSARTIASAWTCFLLAIFGSKLCLLQFPLPLPFSSIKEEKDFDFPIMACIFTITVVVISSVMLILIRLLYVLYQTGKPLKTRGSAGLAPPPLSTLIILGSGGHTAEMLNLLAMLQKDRFSPRFYIAAATDNMSLQKAHLLEETEDKVEGISRSQFMQIYRSREVGQSYITSVLTTLIAIVHALWLMLRIRPQVILCNGPGTCVPLCVIAFLFKVVGIRWSSVFYIESIARVHRLSLSGLLLYKLRIADQFFVQWPQLQRKYPRAHYVGCLM